MCGIPAVVGIVSAVSGIVGGIAQYQQQSQAVAFQNQQAQQQAEYQNLVNQQQVDYQRAVAQQQADFNNAVARQQADLQNRAAIQQADFSNQVALQQFAVEQMAFQQSEASFERQIELNNEAANRAYMSEQVKLNVEQQRAALEAHQFMVSSMQAQGRVLASGRTGQSIGLMLQDASREASHDMAILGKNLGFAQQDYLSNVTDIFNQAQSASNIAQSNRMLEPVRPIMAQPTLAGAVLGSPVMAPDPIPVTAMSAPRPSPLGLVAGIGSAAVGGYQTFNQLQPPSS